MKKLDFFGSTPANSGHQFLRCDLLLCALTNLTERPLFLGGQRTCVLSVLSFRFREVRGCNVELPELREHFREEVLPRQP